MSNTKLTLEELAERRTGINALFRDLAQEWGERYAVYATVMPKGLRVSLYRRKSEWRFEIGNPDVSSPIQDVPLELQLDAILLLPALEKELQYQYDECHKRLVPRYDILAEMLEKARLENQEPRKE